MFSIKKDTIERPAIFGEGDTLFRYDYAAKKSKNKTVLDMGTGYGDGANYIFSHGAKKVIGIDIAADAIAVAQRKFARKGITFSVQDAIMPKFPPMEFDLVTAFEIIEHLPIEKQKDFLSGIKRIVKKDGMILISTPNKLISSPHTHKPTNPYHIKEFLAEELEVLLNKYFTEVTIVGLQIVNKEFVERYDTMGKEFRYKVFGAIGKSKTVRDLAGFIPKPVRMKITGEDKMPLLTASDIKVCTNKKQRDMCPTLMAIIQR